MYNLLKNLGNPSRNQQPIVIYKVIPTYMIIGILIGGLFTGGMCLGKYLTITSGEYVSVIEMENRIAEKNIEIHELKVQNDKLVDTNILYKDRYDAVRDTIDKMDNEIDQIMNKYWFVFEESDGEFPYSHLLTLDTAAQENNINPYTVLAMYKVESNWNPNAKSRISSAVSYGQLIKGTGEWFFEDVMKEGTYDHTEIGADPYENIKITTKYLSYKMDEVNSISRGLRNYNGEFKDDRYYQWVKQKMDNFGKDINIREYVE